MRRFVSLARQRREATKPYTDDGESRNRSHRSNRLRWYSQNSNWTALGTCIIAVATIVSGTIAWFQWQTLGRQADVMAADQRAWISYKITGFEDFTFDDQGRARLPVTIRIKNTGHALAQAVTAQMRMFPNPLENSPKTFITAAQERDKICATLAAEYTDGHTPSNSVVLFPDDGETVATILGMTKEEMEAAKIIPPGQESPYIQPMIVGCAVYRLPFEPKLHKTAFALSIQVRPLIDPGHPCLVKIGRAVPAVALRLEHFFFADDLAD
jgi:hypothetical protein